jgi:Cupin-like domain
MGQAEKLSTEFRVLLPDEWRTWVAENRMLAVDDRKIVDVLVRNGFSEQTAREEIDATARHPYFRAGNFIAQRLRKLESLLEARKQLQQLSSRGIDRRRGLSRQRFLDEYYARNRAVVLEGLLDDWKASSVWTPEYLKEKCGDAVIEVMMGRSSDRHYETNLDRHRMEMLLSEYVDLVLASGETNDYYLVANNHFLEREEAKPLLQDIVMFPEYLNPDIWKGRVFFWFGPAGTITPLHHDVGNIFMAQVYGRKRVILISSDQAHLVYNHLGVHSDVDCDDPDYEKHPLFREAIKDEIVLHPGEVLFLPVSVYHFVKALDVSMTVSFMNFVFPNTYHWPSLDVRR